MPSIEEGLQRQALQEILEAFELAWQAGSRPAITSLLADSRVPRCRLLRELVHTELEYRCKAGEAVRVEEYLQRFPELGEDIQAAVELIVAEYEQRRRHEISRREDYLERFPQYREQLLQSRLTQDDDTVLGGNTLTPALSGLPSSLGRYRIDEEIARGGMGRVLRVWDEQFERPLALKLFALDEEGKLSAPERVELEQRFEREAQLTGQMQHPGIPPVQEKGRLADGRPYFIMKLVKGRNLNELLKERGGTDQDVPRFVNIFQNICDTLAYAHSRGILHRDLKPGNIMVGAFGEVQVMDWGLAKLISAADPKHPATLPDMPRTLFSAPLNSTGEETSPGSILGTPAYLAPEQARGEVEQLDERCDVFGLGGILCTILTGKPPFAAGSHLENHRLAMQGDLEGAFSRLDQCGADADLIRLAKNCLAPRKTDRPENAKAVAAAVRQYQAAMQERVRQSELAQAVASAKAMEERKRRRVTVALAAIVVLLILGAAAYGVWYQQEQVRLAQEQAKLAEWQKDLNRQVTAALMQAETPRQHLQDRLSDPRKVYVLLCDLRHWQALLKARQTSLKQARALADSGKHLLGAEEANRLQQLENEFQVDDANYQVIQELDQIRLKTVISMGTGGEPTSQRYSKVFQELGLDLNKGTLAKLTVQVRQSPLRYALVPFLDHWSIVTEDVDLRQRILQVARQSDPDSWRDQVRDPKIWQDLPILEKLAGEVEVQGQSPQILMVMAEHLKKNNSNPVPLAQKAIWAYPQDF